MFCTFIASNNCESVTVLLQQECYAVVVCFGQRMNAD